jgi:hypothetical protein
MGASRRRNHRGKLFTIIDQIEHGHHVFRVYFKNAILRQYEKFSMFLRNELCSNNLYDFGLKKDLDHPDEVRQKFQTIIGSFAAFQAQWLNVHVDFPLLQRIALPTISARSAIRVIRLSKFLCTAAPTLAAGPPGKSTRPCGPPSTSPMPLTASTNSATICENSRGTDCLGATVAAMPTA